MSSPQWDKVRSEWRANRRLRLAALIALLFVLLHGLMLLGDRTHADRQRYASDLELQARLDGMREQEDWQAREEEASTLLEQTTARIPQVSSAGLAKAELQNWLTEFAATSAIGEPKIRVEDTLDVPGHPELWQVLARLDGQLQQYGHEALLRGLSEALPWIQVERIEIEGQAGRVGLVVRGYYRRTQEPEAVAAPVADAPASGGVE